MLIDMLMKYLRATTTFFALLAFFVVILAYPIMGFGSGFVEAGYITSVILLILLSLSPYRVAVFKYTSGQVFYNFLFLGFFNLYGLVVIGRFGYLFWASV